VSRAAYFRLSRSGESQHPLLQVVETKEVGLSQNFTISHVVEVLLLRLEQRIDCGSFDIREQCGLDLGIRIDAN
jgi:hypothetical protein